MMSSRISSRRVAVPGKSLKPSRDFWDKADIIAKFLSSVVIAVIGILITWSIQRTQIDTNKSIANAQIDAAKSKAQDERRFQENQLTVQLVNHLTSPNGTQRKIAIIALRQSVPPRVYDSIVQVLARTDEDDSVRAVAITQLATSRSPQVSQTLTTIAADSKRSPNERLLAAKASEQVVLTSGNESGTYTFVASRVGEVSLEMNSIESGVFTYALIEGLSGKATSDGLSAITAGSLASFVQNRVASLTAGRQTPVYSFTGSPDAALFPKKESTEAPKIVALVIGVSDYADQSISLAYAASDARAMAKVLQERGAEVTLLANPNRIAVLSALSTVARNSRDAALVVYFAGHSNSAEGAAGWLVSDSSPANPSTWIALEELKIAIIQSDAKTRWLFVDSTSSGELLASL